MLSRYIRYALVNLRPDPGRGGFRRRSRVPPLSASLAPVHPPNAPTKTARYIPGLFNGRDETT